MAYVTSYEETSALVSSAALSLDAPEMRAAHVLFYTLLDGAFTASFVGFVVTSVRIAWRRFAVSRSDGDNARKVE
jgi:hypothetical protein